jgi:serine/threonine protein kinase
MEQTFFDKLAELYTEEDGVNDNFLKEEKALRQIFKKIDDKLGNQYDIVKPLGRGGAGIVIKLWDKVLEVPRALKIPRPIKDELLDTLTNEMSFLKSIHHENVINIYDLGEIDLKLEGIESRKFPYFVMEAPKSKTGFNFGTYLLTSKC